MAATKLEQDTVSRAFQAAKVATDQLKPILDSLDITYNSAGGVKETLDQAELDEVASFSGITKVQVDDGLYGLTVVLRNAIATSYNQLVQLSTRA